MQKSILIMVWMLGGLVASGASASDEDSLPFPVDELLADNDVDSDAAPKADDDDGVICRKVEVTGSHRRVRVCTTRAQREAARDSARELLQDTNRERAGLGREAGGAN